MKKNDWIMCAAILGIAAVVYICYSFLGNGSADVVMVRVDGDIYGTYPLAEDRTVDIDGKNVLRIQDGSAYMKEADCPDQLCVHQKPITKKKESIICLPNKVVVTVDSDEESSLDAVAN